MTKEEQKFINTVGQEKFDRVLTAAVMFLRTDNRFVGMNKVRGPLAHTAAIRALGGKSNCNFLRSKKIAGTEEAVLIQALLDQATEAARSAAA